MKKKKTEKLDELIVVKAASEVLKLVPKLESMKGHVPKLFSAAMAVKHAMVTYGDVRQKFMEIQREAEIEMNGRMGEIEQELKAAGLKAARDRAAAQDAYDRAVNNARSLHGTKLQAVQAALEAFESTRRKLRLVGLGVVEPRDAEDAPSEMSA